MSLLYASTRLEDISQSFFYYIFILVLLLHFELVVLVELLRMQVYGWFSDFS